MSRSDTPIGDSVERDMARPLRRRRLIRRHRVELELSDVDAWSDTLHHTDDPPARRPMPTRQVA